MWSTTASPVAFCRGMSSEAEPRRYGLNAGLLSALGKCFASLRVSAWSRSLGRFSSAAGEHEWRWLTSQAVQVEQEKRQGGKKKSLEASASPSCLLLETLLGSWPPCSSASLQKPLQEKKQHGRVEKIAEEAEEMTKLLMWETSEEGYVCWEIWIYLCCVALCVMPDFTWQLPSISRFQAERRMRRVELEYPKALPPKEQKLVQRMQKWEVVLVAGLILSKKDVVEVVCWTRLVFYTWKIMESLSVFLSRGQEVCGPKRSQEPGHILGVTRGKNSSL